jgi:hypothetical protein
MEEMETVVVMVKMAMMVEVTEMAAAVMTCREGGGRGY